MAHKRNRKKGRQSRASLIILIVLALLLIAASIVLVFSLPEDQVLIGTTQSTTQSSIRLTDGFDCSASEASQLYPFADGIVKMTTNRLAKLDMSGSEVFSTNLDYAAPLAVVANGYFLAADRDNHDFTVIDGDKVLFAGRVDGRIAGASISRHGYLAIISDENDSTGVVSIFDLTRGEKLFDCIFAESGYVLSVSFPVDEDCFDVSLVNTAASEARPLIKRYSLEGQLISQRIPDLTSIYPVIRYDINANPVLCGPNELVAISYESDETVWQQDFIEITFVSSSSQGLVVAAAGSEMGIYQLFVLGDTGKIAFSEIIGETMTGMTVSQDLAAVASGSALKIYDLQNSRVLADQMADAEIIRMAFASDNNLTVVTRAGVRRFGVKE